MILILSAIVAFFILLYLGVKFEDKMWYELNNVYDWAPFIAFLIPISLFWFVTIPLAIFGFVMYHLSRFVIKLARKK